MESNQKNKEELQQINYMRLKKEILLPCKVVGAKGKMQTSCYRDINEKSLIKQSLNKNIDTNITRRQKKTQKEFLKQIRLKSIETKQDLKAEQ